MWKFSYMHVIYRDPFVFVPSIMTHRDMDVMFDDYFIHMVPDEIRSTIASRDWSYVDGYIR